MNQTGLWETIDVETDGSVATLRLNRPERLNAITPRMLTELAEFWVAFEKDPALRVGIVTGTGDRAFCAGADVADVADRSRNRTSVFERENRFTPLQAGVTKPTVCAVNGICGGGGLHFVADCDFSIAATRATFFDPHVSVGQVSATETLVLSRRVPHQAVMRMMLMGKWERVDSRRALEIGLVTEVVDDDELMPRARELAAAIARSSPTAIAVSRRVLWDGLEKPMTDALRYGFTQLRAHGDHHPDAQEGPAAFFEHREPKWADPTKEDAG